MTRRAAHPTRKRLQPNCAFGGVTRLVRQRPNGANWLQTGHCTYICRQGGPADTKGHTMTMHPKPAGAGTFLVRVFHRSALVAAVSGAILLVTGCGPDAATPVTTTQPATTVPASTSIPTENQVATSLAAAAAAQSLAAQQSAASASASAALSLAAQQSAASASASAALSLAAQQSAASASAAAQAQAEQEAAAASAAAQAQAQAEQEAAAAAEAARQSAAEQAQQAPDPSTAAPQNSATVHAGAFCSPGGAIGVTVDGTPMVCKTTATDSRNRWRSAG